MTQELKVGTFLAEYLIGDRKPGARTFDVHLTVTTPSKTLQGQGTINWEVSPPLHINTPLAGTYTIEETPEGPHILVTASGQSTVSVPPPAIGEEPVEVDLNMTLSLNWDEGTANYKYKIGEGDWQEVKDAPVQFIGPKSS